MSLKRNQPAIQAKWLWDWIERGTVEVVPLFGSRVLVVNKNAQPSKVWYEQKKGKIIKHISHYWLGQGIILVPRWDLLETHFDPIAHKGMETLELGKLKQRGLYRLKDGMLLVLIYQHLEDILHFQRQQWHIHLENYTQELQKISDELENIEKRTLENISLDKEQRVGINKGPNNLEHQYRERRDKINRILVMGIASRERAAEILINDLQQELQQTQRTIKSTFLSETVKNLLTSTPASIEGLKVCLIRTYRNLNQIKIRPIIQPLKLIQAHLRTALGCLDLREIEGFKHQVELIIKNIEKAQKFLRHPAEKIKRLQSVD